MSKNSINVSIDKLCVGYDYNKFPDSGDEYHQIWELIDSIKKKEVKGSQRPHKKHSLTTIHLPLSDGSVVIRHGYSQKSFRTWITFNPSKMSEQSFAELSGYLKILFYNGWETLLLRASLNRIDVAIDVEGASYGNYLYVDRRLRTGFQGYINDGTTYAGKEMSTREICAYDKRKELLEMQKIEIGHERLRIEARVCYPSKYRLHDIYEIKNPFDSFMVADRFLASNLKYTPMKALLERMDAGLSANQAYWENPLFKRKILCGQLGKVGPDWWLPDQIWNQYPSSLDWMKSIG